jgi:two-component system sensor histidine kinase CiaH
MFHSARLKLTLFYLAAILALSLSLSVGIRSLAQYEFERSNTAQRGAYRGITQRIFDIPSPPPNDFENFQHNQEAMVGHHLSDYVIEVNIVALIIGGIVSYWFAGLALRPIEEAHNAQKRFASDASHELRTPLTNMRTENEVFLRQKDFSKDDARRQIESNLEEVQRLASLAANLLALTQYENAELELAPIQIKDVIAGSLNNGVQKAQKDKKISIIDNAKPAVIPGNAESLRQLLSIILDNAIKYSPAGSTVTLKSKRSTGVYTLAVSDEGQGIDEADLPHIFERLYRGDKARSGSTPGYGLGLSLAQHIAEANKATLTVVNNSKKGATFSITFSA